MNNTSSEYALLYVATDPLLTRTARFNAVVAMLKNRLDVEGISKEDRLFCNALLTYMLDSADAGLYDEVSGYDWSKKQSL